MSAHLPSRRGRMRGASLVTAIFLLVMLATLAAGMVSLFKTTQISLGLDQAGTQAYLAARAGIDYGIYQVTQGAGPCTTASATDSFALPAETDAAAYSVTVVCTRTVDPLLGQARYTLQATACNQPAAGNVCPNPTSNGDYVQRVINVEFSAPGVP